MNKIIKNLTLIMFLAVLAACGGSDDSSSGSDFTTADPADDTVEEPEPEPEPDPIEEPEIINLGLGNGTGTSYVDGLILTTLATNETLSANGTTSVTVDIVDLDNANAAYLGVQEVFFLSTCSQIGLAEFSPAEMQASATATSTYKDKGCGKELGATDNVVVYIGKKTDAGEIDVAATARGAIDVEAAKVGAVQFIQVSVSTIALSGFGTVENPALSVIEFQVIDESGNPMPDRTVTFELDHELGGASLSLNTAITDQEGKVLTILNSGSVSGAVRIKALVDIKDQDGAVVRTISTLSTPVAMATSLADQNSSSISLESRNPAAWNRDGETVDVTVHLGDHYQNPVIDGTSVYFRTTGGIIEPSCVTSNGACSVKWISANPRPVDGMVTIVAYTRGAGNYQDSNSNGQFDLGESFESFGESYIDANYDGNYSTTGDYQPDVDIDGDGTDDFLWEADAYQVNVDSSGAYVTGSSNFYEEFIDSNNNNMLDVTPSGKYQGVNCSDAAMDESHCDEQMDIVMTTRLQMATTNDAFIEGPFAWDAVNGQLDTANELTCVGASTDLQSIGWRISDSKARRNKLAQKTVIAFTASDVAVITSTGNGLVLSNAPVDTFSVWMNKRGLDPLTDKTAQTKDDYLADRGHILLADILRPEQLSTITGSGTISAYVTTVTSQSITSKSLKVDLLGAALTLASAQKGVVASTINVATVAQDFTVVVQDTCGAGLEEGTLVISAENGVLSNAGTDASSGVTTTTISGNQLSAVVADQSKPTVVTFTLTKDATPNTVLDGLNITLRVPVPGFTFDNYISIGDFDITDDPAI